MALSNRNSRSITVSGVVFQWAVSNRMQGESETVTIVIQPPEDGCRLAVTVPCRDPYLNLDTPAPSFDIRGITPRFVRRLIDDAQRIGWEPTSPAPQFTIDCVIADAQGNANETCHAIWQCPACDSWYSDDIEFGQEPPMMSGCGCTKNHPGGKDVFVILFW